LQAGSPNNALPTQKFNAICIARTDLPIPDCACGGHYENNFSALAWWAPDLKIAKHPVTNGVAPFKMSDEWYYNYMLSAGAVAVLSAAAPDSVYKKKDGPHSCNKYLRDHAGEPMSLAWVYEAAGRRNFAFGGWHNLVDYANDDFRKLLVNMCAWAAGFDVPASGFETRRPSVEEIASLIGREPEEDKEAALKKMRAAADSWKK